MRNEPILFLVIALVVALIAFLLSLVIIFSTEDNEKEIRTMEEQAVEYGYGEYKTTPNGEEVFLWIENKDQEK